MTSLLAFFLSFQKGPRAYSLYLPSHPPVCFYQRSAVCQTPCLTLVPSHGAFGEDPPLCYWGFFTCPINKLRPRHFLPQVHSPQGLMHRILYIEDGEGTVTQLCSTGEEGEFHFGMPLLHQCPTANPQSHPSERVGFYLVWLAFYL